MPELRLPFVCIRTSLSNAHFALVIRKVGAALDFGKAE